MNLFTPINRINDLARLLYAVNGHIAPPGHRFDLSQIPEQQTCWTQAVKADNAMTAVGELVPKNSTCEESRSVWQQVCNDQGWSEEAQIVHLEGFIQDKGLFAELAAYAQVAAEEENQGAQLAAKQGGY